MTIFDLIPLAGRKANTAIAIGFLLTYSISPAATTRFVQSQFKQLTIEIAHDLLQGIPPSLRPQPNHPQSRIGPLPLPDHPTETPSRTGP